MTGTSGSLAAPVATGDRTTRVRRASLVAGLSLLAMAVLAGIGRFVVIDGVVVAGDATQTATNVQDAPDQLRAGIASLLLVVGLDVVVAWALYAVFEPADRHLSALAAWFRLAYAGVFAVAISHLLSALDTLTDPVSASVYTTQQRHTLALAEFGAFDDVWTIGLALFGVHLLLVGVLSYRTAYTPNYLAALLGIAGLGYLVDSLGTVLVQGYAIEVSTVTFVGEVVLIGWLLLVGRTVVLESSSQATEH